MFISVVAGAGGLMALIIGLLVMDPLAIGGGVVLIATGVASWLMRRHEQAARQREQQRKADEVAAEQRRRDEMVRLWGADVAQNVLSRTLWQGATQEQVRAGWGEPASAEEEVLKTKTKAVWKYDPRGNNQFGLRVRFENGSVCGWEKK